MRKIARVGRAAKGYPHAPARFRKRAWQLKIHAEREPLLQRAVVRLDGDFLELHFLVGGHNDSDSEASQPRLPTSPHFVSLFFLHDFVALVYRDHTYPLSANTSGAT